MLPVFTPHPVLSSLGLGSIDQVAFLVKDVEAAAQVYGALFGAFHTFEVELTGSTFRGRPVSPQLRVGFVNHGSIEIEIIEPVSKDGPYQERLEKYGEGLFHMRFPVKDFEASAAALEKAGIRQMFDTHAAGVHVGYFEAPDLIGNLLVELISGEGDDLRHATLAGVPQPLV